MSKEEASKTKKLIISLPICLLIGFLVFYLITNLFIVDGCAHPKSCGLSKPCPTVCVKVTLWKTL